MNLQVVGPNFGQCPETGLNLSENSALIARLAQTPDVLKDAWAVRHRAYASHGYIDPREDCLFSDPCDHFPTTTVTVLYKDERPVGTVRICLHAPDSFDDETSTLPAMEVFGPEIANLMIPGAGVSRRPRIVEIMRLATDPSVTGQRDVALALFMAAGYVMWHLQVNGAVCAVRRHHIPIYRRLGFEQITDARPYPKLKFETALMARMAASTEALRDAMPMLPVSPDDALYEDFVAGLPVPMFDSTRSPESVRRSLVATPRPTPVSPVRLMPAASARPAVREREKLAA